MYDYSKVHAMKFYDEQNGKNLLAFEIRIQNWAETILGKENIISDKCVQYDGGAVSSVITLKSDKSCTQCERLCAAAPSFSVCGQTDLIG